jgi:chromosome segregation ATPase
VIVAALLGSTYADIAAFVGAIVLAGSLWKLIGRGAEGIVLFNKKVVPNVQYMDLLPILNEIQSVLVEVAAQFRSDSGSTLKDTTNRLEKYAQENRQAAAEAKQAAIEARELGEQLKILLGTAKEGAADAAGLARDDRDLARDALKDTKDALREMKKLMDSAAEGAVLAAESRARTEASGERVEAASAVVAEDLANQQRRADDVKPSEPSGSAADAASQSPDGE